MKLILLRKYKMLQASKKRRAKLKLNKNWSVLIVNLGKQKNASKNLKISSSAKWILNMVAMVLMLKRK